MTLKGCDYAFTKPPIAALTAAGVTFVCRYLSTDPAKNLDAAERDALHAAGISIVLVWETTGTSPKAGYNQGLDEARQARAQASALGFPTSLPIYYAVDFQPTSGQLSDVLDYLHGAADAEGSKDRVGPYGSYEVAHAAAGAGYRYLWQTYAWSSGQWESAATIRQTLNGTHIGGTDVDLDEAMTASFGQWPPAGAPAAKPPTATAARPPVVLGNSGYWVEVAQRSVMLAGADPHGVDGKFGHDTFTAVEAAQSALGAHRDGQVGKETWGKLEARTLVVQRALAKHGYGAGGTDSVAGPATAKSVVAFQKARRLLADGIVGGHTSKALGIPAA